MIIDNNNRDEQPIKSNNEHNDYMRMYNEDNLDLIQESLRDKNIVMQSNNITAVVLGVIATICSVLNWAGIPFLHIIGMILGIAAIVRVAKHRKEEYSNLGLFFGIFGLALGALALLFGMVVGFLLSYQYYT